MGRRWQDFRCADQTNSHMPHLPHSLKDALRWFACDLSKGCLEDDRWDWDADNVDIERYRLAIADETCLQTVFTIWANVIVVDDDGVVQNRADAAFRAHQYVRSYIDHDDTVDPPFEPWEVETP